MAISYIVFKLSWKVKTLLWQQKILYIETWKVGGYTTKVFVYNFPSIDKRKLKWFGRKLLEKNIWRSQTRVVMKYCGEKAAGVIGSV